MQAGNTIGHGCLSFFKTKCQGTWLNSRALSHKCHGNATCMRLAMNPFGSFRCECFHGTSRRLAMAACARLAGNVPIPCFLDTSTQWSPPPAGARNEFVDTLAPHFAHNHFTVSIFRKNCSDALRRSARGWRLLKRAASCARPLRVTTS